MKSVRTIIIFIGILIGMSNSMIMQTILTTSLPVISREFGTRAYYSWVYTGYILSSTVTIPVFGKICDKFGCRKNYIIGGAIFFIGLGVGILSSTIMADIQGEIHENPAASNGLAHLMRNFGGTLGVSIVQVFLFRQMNTLFIALFVMGTISLALLNLGNRNFSKRSE